MRAVDTQVWSDPAGRQSGIDLLDALAAAAKAAHNARDYFRASGDAQAAAYCVDLGNQLTDRWIEAVDLTIWPARRRPTSSDAQLSLTPAIRDLE